MKKLLYVILLLAAFTPSIKAEDVTQYYSLNWNIGVPIGSSTGFVGATSLTGGDLRGQIFLQEQIALGFRIGFDRFYENKPRASFTHDQMAITASCYNLISQTPVEVGAFYHFLPQEALFRPYVGVMIGATYMEQEKLIQDMRISTYNWGFIATPEVGVFVRFGDSSPIGLHIAAGYNFNTNTFNMIGQHYTDVQSFNFSIGLAYMSR